MTIVHAALVALSCLLAHEPVVMCTDMVYHQPETTAAAQHEIGPHKVREALDVVLTAEAALAWDVETGKVLYERKADERRPVASLSKLLSVLFVREELALNEVVEIPARAAQAQRLGAHIRLPVGEHATVQDLLAAALIPSANDAVVTLATAISGSEEAFVAAANEYAATLGLRNTKLSNATGLPGGEQYSTAHDVRQLLTRVYEDEALRPFLAQERGSLTTTEGTRRAYLSTNDLLETYVPIVAAKTGFTNEAKENVAIITRGAQGQLLGVVILGSDQRFQDAKILTEWVWRNYSWSE